MERATDDQTLRDFSDEVLKNSGRNSGLFVAEGLFFGVGYATFFPFTVLPGFLRQVSGSAAVSGAVVALYSLGLFGTQLFSAWRYESRPRKSDALMKWSLIHRFALMPLFLVALLSAVRPGVSVLLFFLLYGIAVFSWGMCAPLWTDLIGRWIHDTRRSRILGSRVSLSQIMLAAGSFFVLLVMGSWRFPANYAIVFLVGVVFLWGSMIPLARMREASFPRVRRTVPLGRFVAELGREVSRDGLFRFVLAAFLLASLHTMSTALYPSFGLDTFLADAPQAIRDRFVGRSSFILNGSMALGAFAAGLLSHRKGSWVTLGTGIGFLFLAAALALLAPGIELFLGVFALNGLFLGFEIVGGVELLISVSSIANRMRYVSLANTLKGTFGAASTFAGGALAGLFDARIVFVLTMAAAAGAMACIIAGNRIRSRSADG